MFRCSEVQFNSYKQFTDSLQTRMLNIDNRTLYNMRRLNTAGIPKPYHVIKPHLFTYGTIWLKLRKLL